MRIEVNLTDQAYNHAKRAAAVLGLSVEAFVADSIEKTVQAEEFFTPEVISEIRSAAAEARLGLNMTPEQVDAHFAAKSQSWRNDR